VKKTCHRGPLTRSANSADDLLKAAEAAHIEAEEEEWELPNFQQWFSGLAKVFLDPVVGLHIFFLSLLAFLPTSVALQYDSSMVVMGLFAGGAIFRCAGDCQRFCDFAIGGQW